MSPITLGCDYLQLNYEPTISGQCGQFFEVPLVDNTTLQNLFSDRATVVRVLGDLWMTPIPLTTGDDSVCEDGGIYARLQNLAVMVRMGIRTFDLPGNSSSIQLHPLSDINDWTEGRWKKSWQIFWPPGFTSSTLGHDFLCNGAILPCSTQPAYTVPALSTALGGCIADGTGCVDVSQNSYTVPAQVCDTKVFSSVSAVKQGARTTVKFPATKHVPLDIKKRFPLRENQYLSIQGEFGEPAVIPGTPSLGSLLVHGGIRVLLEY